MCELKVIVNQKQVFENVIYAKTDKNTVEVKDILGNSMTFKNHTITEVNIAKEQLVLTPTK
ncbi:MAG: CooT family nickel-binding protein [Candidatus Bathyarchaeia archaeon]|jgi:predicted RNA-binding protein